MEILRNLMNPVEIPLNSNESHNPIKKSSSFNIQLTMLLID